MVQHSHKLCIAANIIFTHCSDEDVLEYVSAKRQGHDLREEQAEANQTAHITICIEPLWSVVSNSRGIEAGLSWLVEEGGF